MTSDRTVVVEVLTASGCGRCQKLVTQAAAVVSDLANESIQYRVIDVVEEIDYAVELGVISTPAIALDGELVFPAPPSRRKLREAILKRLEDS